ncbi:hypothetical protein ACFFGH_15915 [Lysobacter korlensis]|uniref:HAMP domain-containing protein n=1 Tax=Lysobacter korlensis TaxID=553636 RepID=A0ABV6RRA3_9GAMM
MSAKRFLTVCVAAGLLLIGLLAAMLMWQRARVLSAHDAQLSEQVRAAQRVVETQHRDALRMRAEQVADDPAFAGYVEQAMGGALPGMPVDTTSIADLLRERQNQLGHSASAVLDRNGRIIAATADLAPSGTLQGDPVFERARAGLTASTGIRVQGEGLAHTAVLPLAAVGVSEGFLLVASPVDLRFAQSIASATGTDVILKKTGSPHPVASTLGTTSLDAATKASLSTAASARIAGAKRPVLRFPLLDSSVAQLIVVAPDAPRAALAGALTVPWLLLGAALLTALAAAAWSLWRFVLQPAEEVATRLDRASGGDYRLQFPEGEAGAMVPLASAFNRLMVSLRS